MAKCAVCQAKKGKRNCPALAAAICSTCCGTQRQRQIDCPDDCPFLGAARQYRGQKDSQRRLAAFDRELRSIIGNETAYQGMLHNIEFMIYRAYRNQADFTDAEVAEALTHILEKGKARLGLAAEPLPEPSVTVQTIIQIVNDAARFKAAMRGQADGGMDVLKCVYRVLDSVNTHADPDNPFSYLDFIGTYVGTGPE